MKHIVSISLGSSTRNKKVTVELGDETITVERIGTDGNTDKANALFRDMDGKVDVLGMGGIELHIEIESGIYALRAARNLAEGIKETPIVDGLGVKHTLERQVMQIIEPQLEVPIKPKKGLMPLAIDRYGMAKSLDEAGYDMIYGDLLFGLGIPISVHGLANLSRAGRLLLPFVCQLPIRFVYPVGEQQDMITPKYHSWFNYGPVIAGDFHYIRRYLPKTLEGRMIITNTTTSVDVELLKKRGLRYLVTTTPVFEGRSFGTNVIEAMLTALAEKGRVLTKQEIATMLNDLNIKPMLRRLNY